MTLNRSLKRVLTALLSTIVIFFGLAVGLVLSQPVTSLPTTETLSFDSTGKDTAPTAPLLPYTARDGTLLAARHYPGQSSDSPLVVVVHGSGWHGGAYAPLGKGLSDSRGFEVLVPDLRGHGPTPKRRGDVDHIGQLEDDLADLIAVYRKPGQPLYMVGHSSGGGLTIRFAGGAYGDMLDKAVLIAPFLKYDAPTARSDAGGWSHVLTRRVIGLSMLNSVGITALNGLHMIQFNFPPAVLQGPQGDTATQSYSYRLNTSFAPRSDYLADAARLPDFLLIAGTEDDAFRPEAYEPTMSAATPKGTYRLIDGADHLGILVDPDALDSIGDFLQR